MVLKIGHKSEFAQGSHKVRIPVIFALRFWVGTESMVLKICHKNEFAQGSHKVRIPVKFALRFWEGTESMHF